MGNYEITVRITLDLEGNPEEAKAELARAISRISVRSGNIDHSKSYSFDVNGVKLL